MDTCAHHVGPREYRPFPAIEHRQLFTQPPRAVCTTVDRLRYSLHESLFDGSEGKSACGCRPGHAKGRESSHAGGFSTHHKARSETQKGDGVGGTEASSQAYLLNRPERRAKKSLVEPARRARRRHSGETLPAVGEKARS